MESRADEEASQRAAESLDVFPPAPPPSPSLEQLLRAEAPVDSAQLEVLMRTTAKPKVGKGIQTFDHGNQLPELLRKVSRASTSSQDVDVATSSPYLEPNSLHEVVEKESPESIQNIAATVSLPPSEADEHSSGLNPEDIPLPGSELDFEAASLENRNGPPPAIIYRRALEGLAPLLPYLGIVENRNVRSSGTGRYSYYDYDATMQRSPLVQTVDALSLLPSDTTTKLRFIFMEDLHPVQIDAIGSSLGIPPGIFASHLTGSGYSTNEVVDASQNNLWSRIRPGKGQFTMSWLRPVFLSVSLSLRFRDRLLAGTQPPGLPCVFPSCQNGEKHKVATDRNIFRRPVSLSAQPGSELGRNLPVGWNEKLSVWQGRVGQCRIFVVCLDPLPMLRFSRGKKDLHTPFSPFFPLSSRGDEELYPNDVMTIEQAQAIDRNRLDPDSTEKNLNDWLQGRFEKIVFPQEALLLILVHDIEDLTEVLRISLEDIEEQSIDLSPAQLQERALHWRPLLGRFQLELRQLSRHVPSFTNFLFEENEEISIPPSSRRRLVEAEKHIQDGLDQVERAYNSLRAELQIAEARRSIEEAESVAKLTELAFLFIPLTFAASLFSMQVQELQSNPPASYFVATAIGFMGLAYAIRLAVRSAAIKQYRGHVFGLISAHADLSEGEHPSTRQFLTWLISAMPLLIREVLSFIFHDIFARYVKQIIIALICGVIALPTIFLWRRGFNTGYSVVITLVLLPMELTLLWVVSRSILVGDWKSRLEPERKRRRTGSAGTSFMSSVA